MVVSVGLHGNLSRIDYWLTGHLLGGGRVQSGKPGLEGRDQGIKGAHPVDTYTTRNVRKAKTSLGAKHFGDFVAGGAALLAAGVAYCNWRVPLFTRIVTVVRDQE